MTDEKRGEVVSLAAFRKRRERAEREALAVQNRAKHGRTKAQKSNDKDAEDRRRALLDGAEVDDDAP